MSKRISCDLSQAAMGSEGILISTAIIVIYVAVLRIVFYWKKHRQDFQAFNTIVYAKTEDETRAVTAFKYR